MVLGILLFHFIKQYSLEQAELIQPKDNIAQFTLNGTEINVDLSVSNQYFNVATLNTDSMNKIVFNKVPKGGMIKVNGVEVDQETAYQFHLDKIAYEHFIEISINSLNCYIHTLPSGFPDYFVNFSSPTNGVYYLDLQPYIIKMDTKGNILYYNQVNGKDFRRWEIGDIVRYSYFTSDTVVRKLEGVPTSSEKWVIMDENYNIIDQVNSILGENYKSNYEKTPLDAHDAIFLGDNHYIILAYKGTRVTNIPQAVPHSEFGVRVVATVIQEIKDGQVLWEWNSTNYPQLYQYSVEQNDYFNEQVKWADYMHTNSLFIDTDENIIISVRHMNSVIKINRTTGEIMWILGGEADQFNLTEDQKFSRQHYAHRAQNGNLLIFNNGNKYPITGFPLEDVPEQEKTQEVSSIIEIDIDEETKEVIAYQEYDYDKRFSAFSGSVEKTQENTYFICWGNAATGGALFSEIDFANKKTLFELVVDSGFVSYRAHKYSA